MKNLLLIAAATAPLIAVTASANTSVLDTELLTNCATVATPGSDAGEVVKPVADCVATRMIDDALDAALALTNASGKARFGTGFSVQKSLHYSVFNRTELSGDIDLVLPLRTVAGDERNADGGFNTAHAFFMQNGVTRWTDAHGDTRHDARFGLVHRARTGQGIFGSSLLLQQNRERGHERLAAGVDYVGRWGTGALTWYAPQTDWRAGRLGFEERALGGVELDLRFTPTSTIGMNIAGGKWDNRNGVGDDELRARLGLQWRPHTYLRFSGEADDIGGRDSSHQIVASVEVPLGGGNRVKPRWQGFGVASSSEANDDNLWRRMQPRRIEVAERAVQTQPTGSEIDGVTVRFLQAAAVSGNAIRVEVSLPEAATTDTPLVIRLQPGDDGGTPAQPGVDYVDEPIRVTIRAGESSAIATIHLLNNNGITAARSLGVTVRAG